MKKFLALVLSLCLIFVLSACDDLQRERYEEALDIVVSSPSTSVASLLDEVAIVASEYADDLVVMHVNIVFDGEDEIANRVGTIDFTFGHYNEEENLSTIVIITYDMADGKIYNASFEQGNAAFETDLSNPVNEQIMQSTFADIFTVIENDENYSGKLNGVNVKLTIEMTSENMTITII